MGRRTASTESFPFSITRDHAVLWRRGVGSGLPAGPAHEVETADAAVTGQRLRAVAVGLPGTRLLWSALSVRRAESTCPRVLPLLDSSQTSWALVVCSGHRRAQDPIEPLRAIISTQSIEGNFPVTHLCTGSFLEWPNCWNCSLDHYAPRRQRKRRLTKKSEPPEYSISVWLQVSCTAFNSKYFSLPLLYFCQNNS